jgi:serine/threonine-protein kinase
MLLGDRVVDLGLADFLAETGDVFVVIGGHDSGNTSYGVEAGSERFFVKFSSNVGGISSLANAVAFHGAVQHGAIPPMLGTIRTTDGFAVVHEWREGQNLNDPFVPGSPGREDPASSFARFRELPLSRRLEAFDTILDAHLAVTAAGYVAVDFYDGTVMYDFDSHRVSLCDLDEYRPGPYVLEADRQSGSSRFMAPEEWQHSAVIDERTTVFTLGRAAFVLLSEGEQGETGAELWPAATTLREIALRATHTNPDARFETVAQLAAAWRNAIRSTSNRET